MTPLVSVIIPTANRPQYLPRTVDSALAGMQPGEVEVIVVPNGPDLSWRESLAYYRNNPSVRVLPIETAHANVARNHGLANARGKYVRFLDDDDYLIPHAAKAQLEFSEKTGAEICSGLLKNLDADGNDIGTLAFPQTQDFVCAALTISGFTLPIGNIIRREYLNDIRWDQAVPRLQDNIWMHELAAARDWNWIHYNYIVGVWWQHQGERVSSMQRLTEKPTYVIDSIMRLHQSLVKENRINSQREMAIAQALWYYVHRGFPHRPSYWVEIACKAKSISPLAKPPQPIFSNPILTSLDPLLSQWLLFPLRKISISYNKIKSYFFGLDYRRRL